MTAGTPDAEGGPTRPAKTDPPRAAWRDRCGRIIFEADTPAGKTFDVILLIIIVLSVMAVLAESLPHFDESHKDAMEAAEWVFTGLFTVEYIMRLLTARKALRYACSFFGIVDLMAILPSFIALVIPEAQSLLVIRSLRLLRVFRVFKLVRFLSEAAALRRALWAARAKITVFVTTVAVLIVIMGTAMYLVEGAAGNEEFTSIPQSMYWAVVTMTTVGYGDVTPVTPLGKFLAALMMLIGYSLIIVPTGILSAELTRAGVTSGAKPSRRSCPVCGRRGHADDAAYCKHCGAALA